MKTLKLCATLFCAIFTMIGVGRAAQIQIDFSGTVNSFNPGFMTAGEDFSGVILIDTDLATSTGPSTFEDLITSVSITSAGTTSDSAGTPTENRMNQVQLGGGTDALLIGYDDGFSNSFGGAVIGGIFMDVRNSTGGLFSSTGSLLDLIVAGGSLSVSDFNFLSLSIAYVGQQASDNTILRGGNFSTFNVTLLDAPVSEVPLPGAALFFATGFAGLAMRKKKSAS